MTKEIADAFGLNPESLELLENDEQRNSSGYCKSCKELARKRAELEAELVECRADVERFQNQVEALLQAFPLSSH